MKIGEMRYSVELKRRGYLWTREQWEGLRERPRAKVWKVTYYGGNHFDGGPDYSQYPTPQQRLEWLQELEHFDFLLLADSEFGALVVQVKKIMPHIGISSPISPVGTHEKLDQLEQLYYSTFPAPINCREVGIQF